MIGLGYSDSEKQVTIADYCQKHSLSHVVIISPEKYPFVYDGADHVGYADTIEYRTFYRLLQQVNTDTLIVVNECLRTQNRYELTYNCIRNFLNQTNHWLVFQYLPQIDTQDDFMILFDFATHSRWKRRPFDASLIADNVEVNVMPISVQFNRVEVATSEKTKAKYEAEKQRLFLGLGNKDPHTLPRNLYLVGGADKVASIGDNQACGQMTLFDAASRHYIARNQRIRHNAISTYGEFSPADTPFTIIEFPHRFIDFSDFMFETKQSTFDVLVADLKVDEWYWRRMNEWKDRINATYANLQS